ncbi:MAG: 50S ribosomal protein L17 [Planctomycetaceae bacterium]|jgi:large subunit ribosomal protein L17|nr:50S ribosomal protein L17 [Planctomycetaceae bacterium]
MRHRVFGKQLCVKEDHRRAMLRNLAAGLFEHGQIETTLPKAKAVQPFVEKLITMAKRSGLASRRAIASRINDRAVFAWVADDNVNEEKKASHPLWDLPAKDAIEFNRYGELRKAPRLVQHLMSRVAPLYAERAGGYTRIVKLDKRRVGDQSDLVILQLVGKEDGPQVSGRRSNRRRTADKRTAFAAERRKAGGATAGEAKAEA